MKNLRKQKIFYKYLAFILPFLVLSIVITSAILSRTSYTYFKKTVEQDYTNIIKSSAGEIRLYIENARQCLQNLALVMAATKLDQWQQDIALTAFNHTTPQFMSVSLASREGRKIISTGWKEDKPIDSQREVFEKVLAGESAMSRVMFTKEDIPYMDIAIPVLHLGEVKEVLWGALSLKSVWDVLEGISIGQTGQVSIMDLSGGYVAHRDIARVLAPPPKDRPEIFKQLRETDRPLQWVEDEDGTKSFCLGLYIPDFDWIIVLRQDRTEIYSYIYKNIYSAAIVTSLICLVAVLLGWNRLKRFVAPIHTLHRQVQRIGRGDLDQKVSVDSRDEIGDLGQAFNEMTDSLKNYIQREIENAKELAHAKNLAVLGTTSSKVTHEVGNLLNNVGMITSTLKNETLSPMGKNAIKILEKEAGRVREFIQNFLQFAKKPELRPHKMPLNALIQEVLSINQPDAKKRGIALELKWSPDLPPVNIDAALMYQAVNNLIKNDLEAMTDPGSINITGQIEGEYLVVAIEDTGPGMEQDILEQIFDPFFTTKGKKGTGLGLAIVKTIVETHRGTIECRSEVNKGTTFILRLPLR
jgi:two-component system NtrC family sensor kinase